MNNVSREKFWGRIFLRSAYQGKDLEEMKFGDLEIGESFLFKMDGYLKIDKIDDLCEHNAVNMNTGEVVVLEEDHLVEPFEDNIDRFMSPEDIMEALAKAKPRKNVILINSLKHLTED